MKQTIEGLKVWATRLKLVTALGALFMSGALFSLTVCAWYYDRVISQIHGSYGGRIAAHNKDMRRVQKELDAEREVTRKQLEALTGDMGRLLGIADQVSNTAKQAAHTARNAATTAQGAAANAAKATITVTEIAPEPSKPKPPKFMETP